MYRLVPGVQKYIDGEKQKVGYICNFVIIIRVENVLLCVSIKNNHCKLIELYVFDPEFLMWLFKLILNLSWSVDYLLCFTCTFGQKIYSVIKLGGLDCVYVCCDAYFVFEVYLHTWIFYLLYALKDLVFVFLFLWVQEGDG